MTDYEGEWVEAYSNWFEEKYGQRPWIGPYHDDSENYYKHNVPIENLIWDNMHYSLEDREAFWTTLDDILDWGITRDCPQEEW